MSRVTCAGPRLVSSATTSAERRRKDRDMRVLFVSSGSSDGFPVETAHSGQIATVVRPIRVPDEADEEVGPMYVIRFTDGVEIDAFSDELGTPYGQP